MENEECKKNEYRVVTLCTVGNVGNVLKFLPLWNAFLQPKSIVVIASKAVCGMLYEKQWDFEVECIDEDTICNGLSFQNVKNQMCILGGNKPSVEKRTGWYFQQFLKMAYCKICQEESYLVWDSDTIPTHNISMKKSEMQYYFDVKQEYHKIYFETMSRLFPELVKENSCSFISEHMIFRTDLMAEMIFKIENNHEVKGESFWKKILNVIE